MQELTVIVVAQNSRCAHELSAGAGDGNRRPGYDWIIPEFHCPALQEGGRCWSKWAAGVGPITECLDNKPGIIIIIVHSPCKQGKAAGLLDNGFLESDESLLTLAID